VKIEGWLFAAGTVFFGAVAVVYWALSNEPAGTTAMALTAGLAFLVGYYVLFTGRRIDARPEDSPTAEIADGAGEFGFFSPHSMWPIACAAGAAAVALGFAFGWWLVFLGAVWLGLAIIGFVFEYYRGAFAH
jgi:hypothetical protein